MKPPKPDATDEELIAYARNEIAEWEKFIDDIINKSLNKMKND